ncbi:hypothetical protein P153DRAFT_278819 [Dothidotthia symphoricarpi CBS 119687]|uniref:C3H1-type domain-containing protein n=1 Tax=Dothidotthia symphoricarpi CBS 119687 TaxID=1392245 RepID=A0A6A6ARR7_9PLEO|nr:uncharacterized protein P153DRAFT_278819 [Dothidotthia symphoricarpi CBS 119687]KAF2134672.1 hypothetical protein P153DRAFT_278819 [Dothidotthia symphoricarpi CBS 119687]
MAGANGNGPVPVPSGRMANGHGHGGANLREMGFGGPRSPPNNKNTSHVPCKFYRQGACQAGKACPFLHSDEPLTERAPCKYFTKGNCKFGHKCALAHILPNGHVVNGRNMVGQFGRMNIPHNPEPPMNSSLLTMQAHMAPMQPGYPYPMQDEPYASQKSQYDMIPTIDTTFSSHPGSNYGSPPNENGRLPISPIQKGLSVMDVPLPASFDSQGISHIARYGAMASSVPAKFLATSPPSSYHADSSALRNLHDSAFGDGSRSRAAALGSSPPESLGQPVGRRMLHSELAANRSKGTMSSSVGARPSFKDEEWDDTDMIGKFEEDMLPNSLSDLLTPQEKMRRFSRDQGDNDGNSLSHRASFSRLGGSPTTSDMKVGSPNGFSASPSRFQSLWGKSRPTNDAGYEPSSLPGASAFGHVGSPLRNSSLHPGASPSLRAMNRPTFGDTSSYLSSPPRQASMGMISQQLQRTRISTPQEPSITSNPVHPGINRVTSASSIGSAGGRLGIDRAVSSSSISRERIEEEQGLFSMEEEEDLAKSKDGASTTSSTSNKRLSGLSWGSGGKGSPSLAPVGGHRTAGTSGLGRGAGPWGSNA